MKTSKRNKLEKAGWTVGSASDFLELNEAEETIVAIKLTLAEKLRAMRRQRKVTQQELAQKIGSSQSRVAKMEIADKSVSMELIVRSLVSLGATRTQIGKMIGRRDSLQKDPSVKV
jgi:DNA-binding XRE family transcriptional regulator